MAILIIIMADLSDWELVKVDLNEIATKIATKEDMYMFLREFIMFESWLVCVFLPGKKECSLMFMKDIIAGRKKVCLFQILVFDYCVSKQRTNAFLSWHCDVWSIWQSTRKASFNDWVFPSIPHELCPATRLLLANLQDPVSQRGGHIDRGALKVKVLTRQPEQNEYHYDKGNASRSQRLHQ